MTYVLLPLAKLVGLKKLKIQVRFAEQAWLLLYYAIFWSVGMVCIAREIPFLLKAGNAVETDQRS